MLGWIKSFSPFLATVVSLAVGLGVALMIANGFATAGIGIAIALTSIAAGMAGIKALTVDDMITGENTPMGYGKRALYDEGELTLLNDRDTVIAGTDLFKPALANDMVAGSSQIIENTTIQPVDQNQNSSLEVSQLREENKQTNRLIEKLIRGNETLISATKANKKVEMDDPFGALYTT